MIVSGENYLLNIGKDIQFLKKYNLTKENPEDKTKDPFLIKCMTDFDKSEMLKIRACELLLLEEELNKAEWLYRTWFLYGYCFLNELESVSGQNLLEDSRLLAFKCFIF